jgi:hypothetical protein
MLYTQTYIYIWIAPRMNQQLRSFIPQNPLIGTFTSLKEVGVDKDGRSQQDSLLLRSGTLWEADIERVGIGKDLDGQGFWLLENPANVRSISVGLFLVGRKDMETNLATSFATRISFLAAVDTHATTASRRVDLVERFSIRGADSEHGDADKAVLLHGTEFLTTRTDSSLLVKAALAAAETATKWTINSDHLSVSVEFLR